ncbi:MAG: glycosyltransferase family 39 protein, partial [Desulfosarcina sp.]|nr:glycosyltransferase family 39 protein [Desulfobacterales bacterium]
MSLHLRIPDNRMALGGVVLLSLSVKLTLLFLDKAINTDGILYISAAKLFESGRYGEGWALFPMPAYPFLLYLVHTVIPDWIGAARFISIFAYTAAILPLYALTRTLFDRQAAIWAALLFALSPLANIKSMDIIRDPVFIFCLALYLWCFLGSIRSLSLGLLVAALIFAATSFLFRIEAIVMLGAPCIFLPVCLISAKSREENKWAATSLAIWLLTLGAMLFLAVVIAQHTSSANIIRPDIQSHMEKLFSFSAFDQYHAIYGHLKTVQDSPPFSGFNSSIAAVTRHWMPLVYLVGQTEIFLKALFPVYLIPLLVALKMLLTKQLRGNRPLAFVIFLLGIYFIFVYYA